MNELIIGGRTFRSRLFVGTGKFCSNELMSRAIAASETEMVTVAMKRVDMANPQDDLLGHIRRPGIQLLPNTSGVRNAEEAVLAAQLAREAFGTNFIKLEIHPDPKYLLPDPRRDAARHGGAGPGWVSWCCPTSRRTRCCANVSKRPVPPPSCRSRRRSAPTRGSSRARCSKSSSNRATSPSWSTPGWGLRRTPQRPWSWAPTPCWSIRRLPWRAIPSGWPGPLRGPSRRGAKPTNRDWEPRRATPKRAAPLTSFLD